MFVNRYGVQEPERTFEQQILGLIVEKQEDSLKGKSIEELTAMLA